jgi:hypothetical protein
MVILETEQTLALIKMSPVLTFFLVCCLLGQDWRIKQQLANYTKRGETNLFNSFSRFSPVTPTLYRYLTLLFALHDSEYIFVLY